VVFESEPARWRDTILPETANAVLQMMVKTVEMGTSRRTFGTPEKTPLLQDMDVAGKTGSLSGWTPRVHFEWFAGVAPVGAPGLALAALVVNDNRWKIKGSYVGKEAFNTYFGYPSSTPPVYAKARGGRSLRASSRKGKGGAAARAGKGKKSSRKRGAPEKALKRPAGKPLAGNPPPARPGG
jgi:hypothetical protein